MLVITLGDPHSINVEMISRGLEARIAAGQLTGSNVTVVGSRWHWDEQRKRLGYGPDILGQGNITFVDIGDLSHNVPAEDLTQEQRGTLAVRCLERLRGMTGSLRVLTCPIDKQAAHSAGFTFDGQTEFFEDLWQGHAIMILAGPQLRVGLVTNHVSLRQVSQAVTPELVREKLKLFVVTLQKVYGINRPRIAVAGINPHCGDGGLFGDEDQRLLAPTIEALRQELGSAATISGPLPADTVFYHAYSGIYDGVLAMYHDQGLGPLKTVHFDDAVNLSGGLAHLRVSPDHGPARDRFLKGTASGKSFAACFDLLSRMGR